MNILKNQTGLTIVEMLGTLIILSVVSILTFNIFFNGINASQKAEKTISLQREANYFISVLNKFHEKGANYNISIDTANEKIIISSIPETVEITTKNYDYKIYFNGNSSPISNENVYPESNKNLQIRVLISYPSNPKVKPYEINTTLSRL